MTDIVIDGVSYIVEDLGVTRELIRTSERFSIHFKVPEVLHFTAGSELYIKIPSMSIEAALTLIRSYSTEQGTEMTLNNM